ncbi:hypothetical protein FoTM2_000465 [Fusarium oxysporum f. sp. vasinfectum]|uniref:Uncharacterized protein n=1 Tax=Fusarium oxysporum f. sp. vasinfectum 25433 TaxID=1089449 RepID=X0LW10_FUSOX|nr:hypothetical protein FOTG_04266 [Fusarium oxysporum f. sp. vasinfectum 25433]KAK2937247.1 hypothetical protein FoTM2_000465 [Fusarium oxysporum f. sp. vasinfectum]
MVDIERGQSDLDPYSPSMGEFGGKIRNCHDASMARSRVQSVLANYNQMRLDMPKTIQLKVARFLRHEKWVDSPRNLSQSHQYKMLIGQGRSKVLNFSAWLVVAAIWPSHLRVLGIADEMSRFWGQSFPDTRPFFPTNVSEEEALIKYDGNFVQGDEYPLSDAGDGFPRDKNKEDNGDANEDGTDHPSKRKSNSGDIFNRATKSTRLTELPLCVEGMEQGRIAYLRRKIMARDELISEKDEAIKQRDAQIKELERRRHRRFKEGDKDFRKLFDRVEALKANLKDAAEKEHDLQTYVRQLEDYIKNRDEEIERLSDRNRKIQAKHKGVDRSEEIEKLSDGNGTLEVKVKETSDTKQE